MSELCILEMAVGAKINFENVVKSNPHVGQHPLFVIAMSQLKDVIEALETQDQTSQYAKG